MIVSRRGRELWTLCSSWTCTPQRSLVPLTRYLVTLIGIPKRDWSQGSHTYIHTLHLDCTSRISCLPLMYSVMKLRRCKFHYKTTLLNNAWECLMKKKEDTQISVSKSRGAFYVATWGVLLTEKMLEKALCCQKYLEYELRRLSYVHTPWAFWCLPCILCQSTGFNLADQSYYHSLFRHSIAMEIVGTFL